MDPQYITAWRKRFARYQKEDRERAERARQALPTAVAILRRYGAKRIVLFGSLCQPGRFHRTSDIDLAVEGIPKRDFFRAGADLMMVLDWPVDLKPWEELDDAFRDLIAEKGEVLYEE
jgi:predicted nucleotidyltransferase